jgi:5-methylthioribose kinase
MGVELTPATALAYLREHGVVPDDASGEATALGGGVSNRVVMAETDAGCFVLKQPLANLAVADDWPADVARIHNEASATRAYASVLEGMAGARVPAVRFEDDRDHVAVFSCAPNDAVMWKRELLDGTVDGDVARKTGEILGAVHAAAAGDETLRSAFENRRPLEQLRVDPYHRTVARRHPDVAEEIDREIDRLERVARTLVHGDYSPKNVLLAPAEPRTVWILDFEVAHWGDPAFDVAFMLNHLFIKSVYNIDRQGAYHRAATAFWEGYRADGFDVERETVRELGVLMLARVDGKSPVEYVTGEATADALRKIAKRTLREGVETVAAFRELVVAESESP